MRGDGGEVGGKKRPPAWAFKERGEIGQIILLSWSHLYQGIIIAHYLHFIKEDVWCTWTNEFKENTHKPTKVCTEDINRQIGDWLDKCGLKVQFNSVLYSPAHTHTEGNQSEWCTKPWCTKCYYEGNCDVIDVTVKVMKVMSLYYCEGNCDVLMCRQLRCTRVIMHQHLFLSYIITGVLWTVSYTQLVLKVDVIRENPVSMRTHDTWLPELQTLSLSLW